MFQAMSNKGCILLECLVASRAPVLYQMCFHMPRQELLDSKCCIALVTSLCISRFPFHMYGDMIGVVALVNVTLATVVAHIFALVLGMFDAAMADKVGEIGKVE